MSRRTTTRPPARHHRRSLRTPTAAPTRSKTSSTKPLTRTPAGKNITGVEAALGTETPEYQVFSQLYAGAATQLTKYGIDGAYAYIDDQTPTACADQTPNEHADARTRMPERTHGHRADRGLLRHLRRRAQDPVPQRASRRPDVRVLRPVRRACPTRNSV